MFNDVDFGKKPKAKKDLEPMSLDELDHYIDDLREEIVRSEEEIKRKKAHMEAAASAFK